MKTVPSLKGGRTLTIRWGILGAANIAKQQMMPAIKQSGGIIQAIASRSQNTDDLVQKFEIAEVYSTYEELLGSNIDAVYIPLPNALHYEWILNALDKGKHVLVEKPIVLEPEEIRIIKEKAEKNHLIVMEAFMYRFHPQIVALKNIINNREIGQVISMKSTFHFVLDDWENDIRINKELGGGVLYDIGCYCINVQQFVLGQAITESQIIAKSSNNVDVQVSGSMLFENGVIGQIDCSFYGHFTNTFEVIGTKGRIYLPHVFRSDMNDDFGVIEIYKGNIVEKNYYEGNAYELQIQHFEQLIFGAKSLYTLDDIEKQVKTLSQIYNNLLIKEVK